MYKIKKTFLTKGSSIYDVRWQGGSAKSDFISKGSLVKHLMRGGGGVKKGQKSSDVIYGRSLRKNEQTNERSWDETVSDCKICTTFQFNKLSLFSFSITMFALCAKYLECVEILSNFLRGDASARNWGCTLAWKSTERKI